MPDVHMQLSERRGGFDASAEFRRFAFERFAFEFSAEVQCIRIQCSAEVARAAQRLTAELKVEDIIKRFAAGLAASLDASN